MNEEMGTCRTCYHRDGGVCRDALCDHCGQRLPCTEVTTEFRCRNYYSHPYGSYEAWLEEYPYEAKARDEEWIARYNFKKRVGREPTPEEMQEAKEESL